MAIFTNGSDRQMEKLKLRNTLPQPGRDDHILVLCHMLSNRIGKAFAPLMEEQGLTVAEWRVIMTLSLHGVTSGQEISNRWAMEKMAVNRAITNLEERGLIEKKRNEKDRRHLDLMFTTAGQALNDKLTPLTNEHYFKLTACLDSAEKKELGDALTKMILFLDTVVD